MQLVKHSLQLARRHNQLFQLNTDRRLKGLSVNSKFRHPQ